MPDLSLANRETLRELPEAHDPESRYHRKGLIVYIFLGAKGALREHSANNDWEYGRSLFRDRCPNLTAAVGRRRFELDDALLVYDLAIEGETGRSESDWKSPSIARSASKHTSGCAHTFPRGQFAIAKGIKFGAQKQRHGLITLPLSECYCGCRPPHD